MNGALMFRSPKWVEMWQFSARLDYNPPTHVKAIALVLDVPNRHLLKWDNKRTGSETRNATFQTPNFLDFKWDSLCNVAVI